MTKNSQAKDKPEIYWMCWGDCKYYSFAKDPKEAKREIFLPAGKFIEKWTPIHFRLEGDIFGDYQVCSHALQLFSLRFRELIDSMKTEKDKYQWLEDTVTFKKETRTYFILHFIDIDDVLDKDATLWNSPKPRAIIPAFQKTKITGRSIFTYGDSVDDTFDCVYVSKELRDAAKKMKMLGVKFERAKVV
jgi:hypothetical protein